MNYERQRELKGKNRGERLVEFYESVGSIAAGTLSGIQKNRGERLVEFYESVGSIKRKSGTEK